MTARRPLRADALDERDRAQFVRWGALGARQRWGAPRHLRIDRLSPEAQAAILAIYGADIAAQIERAEEGGR
jgi:hypothetical protein